MPTPIKILLDLLSPILISEGFRRDDNLPGFVKIEGEKKWYVEIAFFSYNNTFLIDLSCLEGRISNGISLGEFEGEKSYVFNKGKEDTFDFALIHLKKYGIPWLRGNIVKTKALLLKEDSVLSYKFNNLVEKGRNSFKNNFFSDSIKYFEEAKKIKELSGLDLKFYQLAKKKNQSK